MYFYLHDNVLLLLKQKQNLYRIQCIYTVLKDLLIPVERLVIALQTNMISLKNYM